MTIIYIKYGQIYDHLKYSWTEKSQKIDEDKIYVHEIVLRKFQPRLDIYNRGNAANSSTFNRRCLVNRDCEGVQKINSTQPGQPCIATNGAKNLTCWAGGGGAGGMFSGLGGFWGQYCAMSSAALLCRPTHSESNDDLLQGELCERNQKSFLGNDSINPLILIKSEC